MWYLLSTIQVEDDVKRELFMVAAELQSKLGRRVSLSEGITMLLDVYKKREREKGKILSLFGSLGPTLEARELLRELRAEEDRDLERLAGKHDA